MLRLRFILGILLLVALVNLLPAQAAPSQADLPGDFMGMVIRDPYYEYNTNPAYPDTLNRDFYDAMGRNLGEMGARWVRFEFRAEDNIPYNPNDPAQGIRFEAYDYFVNEVAPRHNLKIVALLATPLIKDPQYYDPELLESSKAQAAGGDYGEVPNCFPNPETGDPGYRYGCGTTKAMRIWLDHAFAIAARYQDRIAAYEVMNEQNRYLNGGGNGIDPPALATLQTKFYRIFKRTGVPFDDPAMPEPWRNSLPPEWTTRVKIIVGGLHTGPCDDCRRADGSKGMTDREYLDALYKTIPFQNFRAAYNQYPSDGIGFHPYPAEIFRNPSLTGPSAQNEETGSPYVTLIPLRIERMRAIMEQNGDNLNKLWLTEVGDRGDPCYPDNVARQEQFLRNVYWLLWQKRDVVENVFWFKYEDFAVPVDDFFTPINEACLGPENWGVVRLQPGAMSEYDASGAVQTYKSSYSAFREFAVSGITQPPTPTATPSPTATATPPPTATPTATIVRPTSTTAPTATPGPNGKYELFMPFIVRNGVGAATSTPTPPPSATATANLAATATAQAQGTEFAITETAGVATRTATATASPTASSTATATASPTATGTATATVDRTATAQAQGTEFAITETAGVSTRTATVTSTTTATNTTTATSTVPSTNTATTTSTP